MAYKHRGAVWLLPYKPYAEPHARFLGPHILLLYQHPCRAQEQSSLIKPRRVPKARNVSRPASANLEIKSALFCGFKHIKMIICFITTAVVTNLSTFLIAYPSSIWPRSILVGRDFHNHCCYISWSLKR